MPKHKVNLKLTKINAVKARLFGLKFSNRYSRITGSVFFLSGIVFAAGLIWVNYYKHNEAASPDDIIAAILASPDTSEQVKLYRQLLDQVGPEAAQEALRNSGIPFTGSSHLINHESGIYIYTKYGPEGLPKCRDYFLGSCYHGFLINALAGNGQEGFDRVKESFEYCNKGDITVVTQCSHGIGHGFVAAVDYENFDKALEMCSQMEAQVSGFPIFNCFDGAFMENIYALHGGSASPKRWIKPGDNFYPCTDKRLQAKHLDACWNNQATLVYSQTGSIEQMIDTCLQVKNRSQQEFCFDGLSRQMHPLTNNQTDKIFEYCNKLPGEWVDFCNMKIMRAGFSVGDRVMPYEICARIDDSSKPACYQDLATMISMYSKSDEERQKWCAQLGDENREYQKSCM